MCIYGWNSNSYKPKKQKKIGTCQAQTARLPKVGTGASACEKNEFFAELKK